VCACGSVILVFLVILKRGSILIIVVIREPKLLADLLACIDHTLLSALHPDASRAIGNGEGWIVWWLATWHQDLPLSRLSNSDDASIFGQIDDVLDLNRDAMMPISKAVDPIVEEVALVIESAECPLLRLYKGKKV